MKEYLNINLKRGKLRVKLESFEDLTVAVKVIKALKEFDKGILPHGALEVLPRNFFLTGFDFKLTSLVFGKIPVLVVKPKATAGVKLRSSDALH